MEDEGSTDGSSPEATVPRGNPNGASFRACENCRSRKVKCVMSNSTGPCDYCAKHRTECIQLEPQPKRKRKSTATELKSRVDTLERQLQEALNNKRARGDDYNTSSSYGSPVAMHPQQYDSSRYLAPPPPPPPAMQYQTMPGPPPPPPHIDTSGYGPPRPPHDVHPPHPGHFHKFVPPAAFSPGRYSNERILPQPPSFSRQLPNPSHSTTPQPPPFQHTDLSGSTPRTRESDASSPDRPGNTQPPSAVPASREGDEGGGMTGEKLLGPIASIDKEFFELCVRRGMEARENAQTPQPPWQRFTLHSADEALPIYRVSFAADNDEFAPMAYQAVDMSSQAYKEFQMFFNEYGTELLDTFDRKIAALYRADTAALRPADGLAGIARRRLISYCAAAMCLAALCVEKWPLSKRISIACALQLKAHHYLAREFRNESSYHLKTLIMLSDFSLQPDGSIGVVGAINIAFELKLHIDPRHWRIPEADKMERRRLWYILLVKERLVALRHPRPTMPSDCFDTEVPEVISREDEAAALMVDVSGLISDINSAFYLVKGARMVHDNAQTSCLLAHHFCDRIKTLKARSQKLFPAFEHMPDLVLGMQAACCLLHIEYCTLMVARPFFNSKHLSEVNRLELRRTTVEAACNVMAVLRRMPDGMFDQFWSPSACLIIHGATIDLLRASVHFPEKEVKQAAAESLDAFFDIALEHRERWPIARSVVPIMRIRANLTGVKAYASPEKIEAILKPYVLEVRKEQRSSSAAGKLADADGSGGNGGGGSSTDDADRSAPQVSLQNSRPQSNAGTPTPRSVPFGMQPQSAGTGDSALGKSDELSPWQQHALNQQQQQPLNRQQLMLNHSQNAAQQSGGQADAIAASAGGRGGNYYYPNTNANAQSHSQTQAQAQNAAVQGASMYSSLPSADSDLTHPGAVAAAAAQAAAAAAAAGGGGGGGGFVYGNMPCGVGLQNTTGAVGGSGGVGAGAGVGGAAANINMAINMNMGSLYGQSDFDDLSQLLGLTTPMMGLGDYFGSWGALG